MTPAEEAFVASTEAAYDTYEQADAEARAAAATQDDEGNDE